MTTILVRMAPRKWNDASVVLNVAAGWQAHYTINATLGFSSRMRMRFGSLVTINGGVGFSARMRMLTDEPVRSTAYGISLTSGAHFRFSNFAFNSFLKCDGKYYGCTNSGIFLLSGDVDTELQDEAPVDIDINWLASSGDKNFGTDFLKRLGNVKLVTRTENDTNLKLMVDEQIVFDQIAIESDGRKGLHALLAKTPKGLKGTVFRFILYGAGKNQITSMTVVPYKSDRTT